MVVARLHVESKRPPQTRHHITTWSASEPPQRRGCCCHARENGLYCAVSKMWPFRWFYDNHTMHLYDSSESASVCFGPKRACARRSLGKEERCRKQLKTFRRNPVGQRAHPEESGQQPEASLASCGVTHRAKRRQRVSRAGPFSPEIRSHRGSPCRACRWGPRLLSCLGLGGRSRRGL